MKPPIDAALQSELERAAVRFTYAVAETLRELAIDGYGPGHVAQVAEALGVAPDTVRQHLAAAQRVVEKGWA